LSISAPPGGSARRTAAPLIDHVLGPLEERYLSGQREATTVARIKKLRMPFYPLTEGNRTAEEQALAGGT